MRRAVSLFSPVSHLILTDRSLRHLAPQGSRLVNDADAFGVDSNMEISSSACSTTDDELLHKFKLKTKKQTGGYSKCVLCKRGGKLEESSVKTMETIKRSVKMRLDAQTQKNDVRELSDLINNSCKLRWHRNCYSSFTSLKNISTAMKLKLQSSHIGNENVAESNDCQKINKLRCHKPNFNINLCVFCQKLKKGKSVSQILTTNFSNKLHAIAIVNYDLFKKINTLDLIAAEVKYHSNCFVVEWKKYNSKSECKVASLDDSESQMDKWDEAWKKIGAEIKQGISKGKVYNSATVYDRYVLIGGNLNPQYFLKKLKKYFKDDVDFVKSYKRNEATLMYPKLEKNIYNEVEMLNESDFGYQPFLQNDSFLSALHLVASEIKKDLRDMADTDIIGVPNTDNMKKCVPASLLNLLGLLLCDYADDDKEIRILSIAQDITFSYKKNKPPKQVMIGLSVHQSTRSKKLVDMLHRCGHSISYADVLGIRNTIAQTEIDNYFANDSVFVPQNLNRNRFIQFAADNIDVLEETIDGRNTFHATQMVAFQQCPENQSSVSIPLRKMTKRLLMPQHFHSLSNSQYTKAKRPMPLCERNEKYVQISAEKSKAYGISTNNLVWILSRTQNCDSQIIPQWTGFNKITDISGDIPTFRGYFPIIAHIASEYDTLWTVMLRCRDITSHLNVKYTVITFDQALYCKAKELQWLHQDECKNFVLRLGGFHIMLNFVKVIGQRLEGSGFLDIIVESGVYSSTTCESILKGKLWNRAIRCHKLVYESLWRILMEEYADWLDTSVNEDTADFQELMEMISELSRNIKDRDFSQISEINLKAINKIRQMQSFSDFLNRNQNETAQFWMSYLDMVNTLLTFIHAERIGDWNAYLRAFYNMLPWFAIYGHQNYTRWGTVYFLDMTNLENSAPDVFHEYTNNKCFSVKTTANSFNRIAIDQALEHVNRVSKVAGGIVGITKNDERRDEWCLSFNIIGKFLEDFDNAINNSSTCASNKNIELGMKRLAKDETDVIYLKEQFCRFAVFSRETSSLVCITTNDVIETNQKQQVLNAKGNGFAIVDDVVSKIGSEYFYKPLKKSSIKSFSKNVPRKITPQDKCNSMKKGQQLIQRLLAVSKHRNISLEDVYSHELTDYPMSISANGVLSTPTTKSTLGAILQQHGEIYTEFQPEREKACVIIDAMSIVQSIGKPKSARTFGEYAVLFYNIVSKYFLKYKRVDVVFDYYKQNSLKNCTRQKRAGQHQAIRKIVDGDDIPLPVKWENFVHSWENKRDLTHYLSTYIMTRARSNGLHLVTSGGFRDFLRFDAVNDLLPQSSEVISSNHEEADTRMLLHILSAKAEGYTECVIFCKDTDVLVLLVHFFDKLNINLYMQTAANKIIDIKSIKLHEDVKGNLLLFHALTGCDVTSQFKGIGKKSAWKTYETNYHLLSLKCTEPFDGNKFEDLQKFVMLLYSNASIGVCNTIDCLRAKMSTKVTIDKLPPTSDALRQHCLRSIYQMIIWSSALKPIMTIPDHNSYGWATNENGEISPIFTTKPALPILTAEMSFCACKTGCRGLRCQCRHKKLPCLTTCGCSGSRACLNELTECHSDLSDEEDDADLN